MTYYLNICNTQLDLIKYSLVKDIRPIMKILLKNFKSDQIQNRIKWFNLTIYWVTSYINKIVRFKNQTILFVENSVIGARNKIVWFKNQTILFVENSVIGARNKIVWFKNKQFYLLKTQ